MKMNNIKKCIICNKPFNGYGNNAFPAKMGKCCDECNENLVIPLRIMMISNPNKALEIISKLSNNQYFKVKLYDKKNKR